MTLFFTFVRSVSVALVEVFCTEASAENTYTRMNEDVGS